MGRIEIGSTLEFPVFEEQPGPSIPGKLLAFDSRYLPERVFVDELSRRLELQRYGHIEWIVGTGSNGLNVIVDFDPVVEIIYGFRQPVTVCKRQGFVVRTYDPAAFPRHDSFRVIRIGLLPVRIRGRIEIFRTVGIGYGKFSRILVIVDFYAVGWHGNRFDRSVFSVLEIESAALVYEPVIKTIGLFVPTAPI